MKISWLADIHVENFSKFGGTVVSGLNDRCRAVLTALQEAVDLYDESDSELLLINGDLVDTTHPTPQVIAAIAEVLMKTKKKKGIVVGNHDQVSTQRGDHALGPLALLPSIEVFETPTSIIKGGTELIVVPYMPGSAKDNLKKIMIKSDWRGHYRILAAHMGVWDQNTPPFLQGATDSMGANELFEFMQRWHISQVFVGNWHSHKAWEMKYDGRTLQIVQIGALTPTGFDNVGLSQYGSLIHSKPGTWKRETIRGTRFISGNWEDLKEVLDIYEEESKKSKIFLKVSTRRKEFDEAAAILKIMVKKKQLAGYEIVADKEEVYRAARAAVVGARHADTVHEAIAEFVNSMHLKRKVPRKKIISRVTNYLIKAR